MNKKKLWSRIKAYHFDHLVPPILWQHIAANFGGANAFSKAFASKIARKHGWKNSFALQALEEYKKFVYLGVIGEFQVTPSKIIDTVWHEHLLFTKGYRQFCTEVIEYEFDHYPELVPVNEQIELFNAQYVKTLELYEAEFNRHPPATIWDTTKYNRNQLSEAIYQPQRKNDSQNNYDAGNSYLTDAPLYTLYASESGGVSNSEFGGGDFGGAGASGGWSDSGDSSSDGSSDGGSSCSSGCGGGD